MDRRTDPMRVKITFSPSGDPAVGRVMTVSDRVGRTMISTGRAVEHTDPPASAGYATSGEPGPVGQEILAAAGPSGEVIAKPDNAAMSETAPTDQPAGAAETSTPVPDAPKGGSSK
jgi:hypothetical protein